MGVAKAALECHRAIPRVRPRPQADPRQHDQRRPRENPSAPCAVGGIDEMFEHTIKKSPLHRNIEGEEVGKTAVYLLSDLSSGVTGENIFVDSGFNIVGL